MISTNTINGKSYDIPEILDDRAEIDNFLERNKDKRVVVVQGLGFVGAVMSLVVANALEEEYAVIGIDLPTKNTYWKIRSINEGTFPVIASDEKIQKFYESAMRKGNLLATYDPYCYSKADVIIVDINLDVQKKSAEKNELQGFEVSLEAFKKAIGAIGNNAKEDVLILVETTVPPGTCQKVVKPIVEECFTKRNLTTNKFKLGHSYERVMPGPQYIDSIQNFYRVYSGINNQSADATEQFLKTIIRTDEYPLTRLGTTNATEMAKVLENSYRAVNIAFVSEWALFAEEAEVNLFEVVNAIRMRPTHKNLMLPGLGVGGYCLTKDPLLASWSRQNLFNSSERLIQSENGVKVNDQMPLNTTNLLKKYLGRSLAGSKILLLGVSYLNDVGDTRYTPVELLYDVLVEEGAVIALHDPHVTYWEERELFVSQDLEKVLQPSYDIIIYCTGHKEYRNNEYILSCIQRQPQLMVLDAIGILKDDQINELKKKHIVKVVGRGDI